MTITVHNHPAIRVEHAAQWLDETLPYWAGNIDLATFEMADHNTCIGGQNGKDWEKLARDYEAATGNAAAGLFASYDEHWIEQIEKRIR